LILQLVRLWETSIELCNFIEQTVNLLTEKEKSHHVLVWISDLELFQCCFLFFLGEGAANCWISAGHDLFLNILRSTLGILDLVLVMVFNISQFLNEVVWMLRSQIQILCKVLGWTSKTEDVRVESGHVWLDVVEKESLEQVGSMDLHWYLLKEVLNGQLIVSNYLLD